jgi:uncharacterized membrane protein
MPEYVYTDKWGHSTSVVHPMEYSEATVCFYCHEVMWRVPQVVAVNWQQPKPSDGGLHPMVANLNEKQTQLKEKFYEKREEHYKRTGHGENVPDSGG